MRINTGIEHVKTPDFSEHPTQKFNLTHQMIYFFYLHCQNEN